MSCRGSLATMSYFSGLSDANCCVGFARSRAGTRITPLRIWSNDFCKSALSILLSTTIPLATNSERSSSLSDQNNGLRTPACLPNLPLVARVCSSFGERHLCCNVCAWSSNRCSWQPHTPHLYVPPCFDPCSN